MTKKPKLILSRKLSIYAFMGVLALMTFVYACKKNNESISEPLIKDQKAISALKLAYGYNDFDIAATPLQKKEILSAAQSNSKFGQISKQLNLDNIRVFNNSKDGITVVMFGFLDSKEQSFALKGSFQNNSFVIQNEAYVERITNNDKIQTLISKDDEFFLLETENKVEKTLNINFGTDKLNISDFKSQLRQTMLSSIKPEKISLNDQYGNHGGNGFCQRERNESFNACFNAEKDEFCTDFFSCLGSNISPEINVLIGLSCSCSASQSD